MLVLSRKRGEQLLVGRDVVITVLDVRGDRISLGVQAPKEIPVHRAELYAKIQLANALNPLSLADRTVVE